MIKCLGEDVRARLRSGVTISSLGQCVEELVLNSIDAKATCVAVRVDLEAFKIQVVDNGSGMGREDLNAMGRRYFTSKCYSVGDLENLTFYGFRGEAVASIVNMASIVEITSKTSRTAKTFVKLFHNGQALEVCEPELSRPSGGTTVTVCNLFHQLPVRKKCMDPVLEFERVRQKVEAVSLMHPSVSLSLRNDVSCSMVLQLPKTRDVCSRFCQLYGLGRAQKLREIHHRSRGFELSGYIGTEGHYNKNMQFLYVNRRLVLKTRVHKLIDSLLRKESVICKAKSGPMSRQDSSSPGRHHCSPELYGVFILNVTCAYSDYDVCLEPAKTLIEFQNWDDLLTCVEEGVKTFLKQEHLFFESCSENIRECNEEKDFNDLTLKPSISVEKSIQESFKKACNRIADSYEMRSLQSKNVKRKSTSGKKSSSPVESSTNLQETGIAPDQKVAEPPDLCGNNKAEIALPSQGSTSSDSILLNISEQKPRDANGAEKVSDTNLKPSENLCSSFGGGTGSEIKESVSCGDLQHWAEDYIEGVGSLEGKAVQESSAVRTLNNSTQLLPEKESETTARPPVVSGHSLMTPCDAREEGREAAEVINGAGRGAGSSIPLQLCSTGLVPHMTQSECEQAETNVTLNTQHRLGPMAAKHVFVHPVDEMLRINTRGLPHSTNKGCTGPYTGELVVTDGNEQLESKAVSNEVSEETAVRFATSKRRYGTSTVTELLPAASSGSSQKRGVERRQIAVPRPQPSKKLSLTTQLGSLEKFRRHYGRVKQMLLTPALEQSDLGHLVDSQTNRDSSKNENDRHSNSLACSTPAVEDTELNNSSQVLGALEGRLSCSGEAAVDEQARCQSPLTLSGYSQVSKKHQSCRRSPGSLSSKLSQLKSDHKVDHSSRKDDCFLDLESSETDTVDNACQTHKPSLDKTNEYKDSLSEGDVCWQPDSTGAEPMASAASPSQPSSIEGEHAVSSNDVLSLHVCKDKSTLGDASEQDLKDTEVPCMTFPNNWDFSADNVSAGDPGSDLSSDWLRVVDVSLGKTVHINKATGLSTYVTPPAGGFQAACIEDITTMAVNVVSESDAEGESLQSLLSEWDNPVFLSCPEIAINVTSKEANSLAVKIHNILYPYRFTKDMVRSMQVLQQVDNKFIACLINTRNEVQEKADGNLLILVDQHAAHERVRLEQLLTDSYEKEPAADGKKKLLSSSISPPLEIEVTEEQRRFLRCCYKSLEDLGLKLSFPETNSSLILVNRVPLCFLEREANELRRKRQPVSKSIVEELIQEQVELVQTTGGGAQGTLPLTFLKVLASQACHGAIKFNEYLTLEESCRLIEALSSCQLPFQCAHGRPSMLPLADIDHLQQEKQLKPNLARLRKMAKAWHLFGKK